MKRNKLLDFFLWCSLMASIVLFLYSIITLFSNQHPVQKGVSAVTSLLTILSVILLRRWSKFGFYLLSIAFIISGIISVIAGEYMIASGTVFGIVFWRLMLNLRSGGTTTWSVLKGGCDLKHCRHLYMCFGIASAVVMVLSAIVYFSKDAPPLPDELNINKKNDKESDSKVLKVREILEMSDERLIADLCSGKANAVELFVLSERLFGKNLISEDWARQYWSSTLAPQYSSKYLSGDSSFASQKFVYLLLCQAKDDFHKYTYDDRDYFISILEAQIRKFNTLNR